MQLWAREDVGPMPIDQADTVLCQEAIFEVFPMTGARQPTVEHDLPRGLAGRNIFRPSRPMYADRSQAIPEGIPVGIGVAEEAAAYHVVRVVLSDPRQRLIPRKCRAPHRRAVFVGEQYKLPNFGIK